MAHTTSPLLALPTDILVLLPHHLANLEDFKELSSTCRVFREICRSVSPNIILRLAAASSRVFFRPDPYFLVAATAKQIGYWALQNEKNAVRLRQALKHGQQWYNVEDFWNGGRSDAETIDCEPERALFQMAIYGSLFHATLESNLEGRKGLDLATRLDFIKYSIPDWYCRDYGGFHVEATGPYCNGRDNITPRMDQYSIRHILKSRRWRTPWEQARKQCGPDFEDDRRQKIWVSAVQMQGLEGFEMLRPDGAERWKGHLHKLREKIERIDSNKMRSAEKDEFGEINWLEFPILEDEIFCCVRGMWGYG
ncbi:MAG: hypothetical protein Q9178_002693 [Gyalolechia marmorata]